MAQKRKEGEESEDGALHSLSIGRISRMERLESYHSFRSNYLSSGGGSSDGIACLLVRLASAFVVVKVMVAFAKHNQQSIFHRPISFTRSCFTPAAQLTAIGSR